MRLLTDMRPHEHDHIVDCDCICGLLQWEMLRQRRMVEPVHQSGGGIKIHELFHALARKLTPYDIDISGAAQGWDSASVDPRKTQRMRFRDEYMKIEGWYQP